MEHTKVILAGTPRHLELTQSLGKAKRDFLLINISGTCNYNCKKCCNGVPHKKVEISLSDIKKVIGDAKEELGVRSIVFIGEGETTLAPHFHEIISFVHAQGLHPVIFTTGYFITQKLASFLAEQHSSLVFSMDSQNKERYEYLTGTKDSFERVVRNINTCRKMFAPLARKEQSRKIVHLAINMLLTANNLGEMEKLREFCGDDILPVFNYPLMTGNALENAALFGNVPELLKKLAAPTNIPEAEHACGYFFHGITVGLDGSILACPYTLDFAKKGPNIRTTDIAAVVAIHDAVIREFRAHDATSYCVMRSEHYAKVRKAFEQQNAGKAKSVGSFLIS